MMEKVTRFLTTHRDTIHCGYLSYLVVYMVLREVMLLQHFLCFDWLTAGAFVGGFALLLWDLLTDRTCLKGRAVVLFALFMVACIVSSLVNIQYGVAQNIKSIATMLLEFFVLFPVAGSGDRKKKLHAVLNTLTVVLVIFVAASVLMYLFSIDYSIVSKHGSDQGFDTTWGRLWGVFGDPNIITYLSLISICASGYFMFAYKKVWAYILYGINIVLQLSFVVLTVSRSGVVVMFVTPVLAALYPLVAYFKKDKKRAVCGVALTVLAGLLLCGGYYGLKQGLPHVKAAVLRQVGPHGRKTVDDAFHATYEAFGVEFVIPSSQAAPSLPVETPSLPVEIPAIPSEKVEPIDRKDDKEDVSNGRFARWRAGFEVFKTTPIVGASPHNSIAIAKERTPDTVMAKHGWVAHCSYLEVLFNSGIVGAIPMFGCLLYIAWRLFKRIANTDFDAVTYVAFVCFAVLAIGVFFVSDVFFIFSISAILFYYLLGVLYDREEDGVLYRWLNRMTRKSK